MRPATASRSCAFTAAASRSITSVIRPSLGASPVILHPGGESGFYPVADARVLSRRDDGLCQHPAELEVSGVDRRLVSGADDRLRMRASDHDRQEVVDLLRAGLADG